MNEQLDQLVNDINLNGYEEARTFLICADPFVDGAGSKRFSKTQRKRLHLFNEIDPWIAEGHLFPAPEILAGIKNKGQTWFELTIKWHFAGNLTERYSDKMLGLDHSEGVAWQHPVYRAVFNALRIYNGARTVRDYCRFVSWLAQLDIITSFPREEMNTLVQPWLLTMRPETCGQTTQAMAEQRKEFDPNIADTYIAEINAEISDEKKFSFEYRNISFQPAMLSTVLKYAPQKFRMAAIQHWLTSDDHSCALIRQKLFKQNYYPLCTFWDEYYPWNALVIPITKSLPEPLEKHLSHEFSFLSQLTVENSDTPVPHQDVHSRFGRTFKCHAEGGQRVYLKIQSAKESADAFLRSFQRLSVIKRKSKIMGIESTVVTPLKVFYVEHPIDFLLNTKLERQECIHIEKLIGGGPRLAMTFSCPDDQPYDEYNYDVQDAEEAMTGLLKYARDYGRLWRSGLLGPTCINAYHDSDQNRLHTPLAPYVGKGCEGAIERWNGYATNFPNVGGLLGMRDMGDILFPEELTRGIEFFNPAAEASDDDTFSLNKTRLNELARAAQGIVLLYARRFQADFDYQDAIKTAKVHSDIRLLLSELFSQAAPIDSPTCLQILEQDELLEQCVREVSYWTARDVPYVQDLRRAKINPVVYPHLPHKMQAAVLAKDQRQFLTNKGFHDPERDEDNECQLGAGSGRNPLIALNALIVKMLTHCIGHG